MDHSASVQSLRDEALTQAQRDVDAILEAAGGLAPIFESGDSVLSYDGDNADAAKNFKVCRYDWESKFHMSVYLKACGRDVDFHLMEFGDQEENKTWNVTETWNVTGNRAAAGGVSFTCPLVMLYARKNSECFGALGQRENKFLNVTEACFSRLSEYWKDTNGRTIDEFIAWAVESHEHAIGGWDKKTFVTSTTKSASKRGPPGAPSSSSDGTAREKQPKRARTE